MPWTCQCTAMNGDNADVCIRCGRPLRPVPSNPALWKLGAVAGALVLGGMIGLVLAVHGARGRADAGSTTQTSQNTEVRSSFQQSFDASFKNSCRQSAIAAGNITRAVADNYCSCALEVFNKTHSMSQASADCKKYVFR